MKRDTTLKLSTELSQLKEKVKQLKNDFLEAKKILEKYQ